MTEAEIVPEKSEKATLGKISTETVEATSNDAADAESEHNIEIEKSILQTLRLFLREFFSGRRRIVQEPLSKVRGTFYKG